MTSSGEEPDVSVVVDLGIWELGGADVGGKRSDHWSFGRLKPSVLRNASQLRAMVTVGGQVVAQESSRVDQEISAL